MISAVTRWGNSLALRISASFAREIAVGEGATVDISVIDGTLVVRPVVDLPAYNLDDLLNGITKDNRHGETSTGASVGNEFA